MLWVIQANMYSEPSYDALLHALTRLDLPYQVVKCVPFSGEITPEVAPYEKIIVMGTLTLARVAEQRGWVPGSFLNENFNFCRQRVKWGPDVMLNGDAWILRLKEVPFSVATETPFFLRPIDDGKAFSGEVMDWAQFSKWRDGVLALTPEDGAHVSGETLVALSTRKKIYKETRVWMVEGQAVTASVYKIGSLVQYSNLLVSPAVYPFAEGLDRRWRPAGSYCIDVAETPDGMKVIEVGNLNSCGFYAADMFMLVKSLEEAYGA